MRILLGGSGGVGDAIAKIAARRSFFELMIVTDYDLTRAEKTIAWSGTGVLGPEVFDAVPFLELMAKPEAEGGYGQAWGLEDRLGRSLVNAQ